MNFNEIYEKGQKLQESTPFELDFNVEDFDDMEEREIFGTLYNAFELAKKKLGSKYGFKVDQVAKDVVAELDSIYGPDRTQYDFYED